MLPEVEKGAAPRRRAKMMRMIVMLLLSGAMAAPALSATVTNRDDKTQVLVIVEGANRAEVAVEPGSTQTICPAGCFVTLPNGDRVGLAGGETVEIEGGAASIK